MSDASQSEKLFLGERTVLELDTHPRPVVSELTHPLLPLPLRLFSSWSYSNKFQDAHRYKYITLERQAACCKHWGGLVDARELISASPALADRLSKCSGCGATVDLHTLKQQGSDTYRWSTVDPLAHDKLKAVLTVWFGSVEDPLTTMLDATLFAPLVLESLQTFWAQEHAFLTQRGKEAKNWRHTHA